MLVFEGDHCDRLEQTDFTIVHDSKSIGAGSDVVLFGKHKDNKPSDKICVLRDCH